MKKLLLLFTIFLFSLPFLNAQKTIHHVIFLNGEYVPIGKTLIYQLKDSTIQIIPYEYRKTFNKKTPDELAFLRWQMQDGHLEIPIQEYAVEAIDLIKIRHRAARGRNMIIGIGAGLLGTIIYLNSRNLAPEAFEDSPDWESIIFPPLGIGFGAVVGLAIPTLGKKFRIGKSKKAYEKEKLELGKYAIIR